VDRSEFVDLLVQAAAFTVILAGGMGVAPANADPMEMGEFYRLARRCAPQVAPSTLAAIAKVESGFRPTIVHDNRDGNVSDPGERMQAIAIAAKLIDAGHSVDLGLMQINSTNLPYLNLNLYQAFEPCASIAAAAKLIANGYGGRISASSPQRALREALSMYNTGNREKGFANGYVQKVELAASQIVPPLDTASPAQPEPPPPPSDGPPAWDVWGSYQYEQTKVRPRPPTEPFRGPRIVGDANGEK
jgi:type IV secretion system protein VirB1